MYSPSPKNEVHLSTITLYMDISSNMIYQQNTWDVPFHQTSNGVNIFGKKLLRACVYCYTKTEFK